MRRSHKPIRLDVNYIFDETALLDNETLGIMFRLLVNLISTGNEGIHELFIKNVIVLGGNKYSDNKHVTETLERVKSLMYKENDLYKYPLADVLYNEYIKRSNIYREVANKRWNPTKEQLVEKYAEKLAEKSITENKIKEFVDAYNKICGGILPKVTRITKQRKNKIKARLKIIDDINYWENVFRKMIASDFLSGRISSFIADLDWIIKNDENHVKVMEGKYSKGKASNTMIITNKDNYGFDEL